MYTRGLGTYQDVLNTVIGDINTVERGINDVKGAAAGALATDTAQANQNALVTGAMVVGVGILILLALRN